MCVNNRYLVSVIVATETVKPSLLFFIFRKYYSPLTIPIKFYCCVYDLVVKSSLRVILWEKVLLLEKELAYI